jgi:hypothetical protein
MSTHYFTLLNRNKLTLAVSVFVLLCVSVFTVTFFHTSLFTRKSSANNAVRAEHTAPMYWFILERKSNIEKLYEGVPGDVQKSKLIRQFRVKTGIPGQRPTPLPRLVGREYWKLVKKELTDNPETAPYFLTLDVPVSEDEPYGPVPYLECEGQCNWVTYGFFGLHGVNGHPEKLSQDDPGSSGCIRHTDEDITYLYNLLDPATQEIRYYISDT